MVRVGVVGATGYAGAELVRIVAGHPQMELARATSGKEAGQRLDALYPGLIGATDAVLVAPDADDLAASCDLVFLAVPHTAALAIAPCLTASGVGVVDLSADYRLADASVYEALSSPRTSRRSSAACLRRSTSRSRVPSTPPSCRASTRTPIAARRLSRSCLPARSRVPRAWPGRTAPTSP